MVKDNKSDGMPRREFIRRSLLASGAVFAGMAVGEKMAVPALASNRMPRRPASNCNNGVGNGADCLPPGLERNGRTDLDNDDGPGDAPGNPGNRRGG